MALTAYEYRILEYLMRHHQQVVAKERLMEQLYPDDEERDANVIEVLVGRLRRKLEACGAADRYGASRCRRAQSWPALRLPPRIDTVRAARAPTEALPVRSVPCASV